MRSSDPAPPVSIPVGIVIGLLASFVQSLGLTIQRKSHVINQALPEHKRSVEHRRPLWLLGFAIFISSNVLGSLVQIAALPVVILAPLGAVSLLWNAFFARLILGDVFSPWMILGTILIAGGAVLIAIFGIVPEPTRSLEDLLELFRRPAFAVYFSILMFVVVVSLIATHVSEFSLTRRLAEANDWEASGTMTPASHIINLSTTDTHPGESTNSNTVVGERTPLLPTHKGYGAAQSLTSNSYPDRLDAQDRTRILIAISYSSFSGILSGMCLIFAKSGVQLLLLTLRGQNQFWRWESWVLVLGLVVFALLQLWYLHKALILADPTLVCPSAFCFYNLSSIINGLVYFNQISLIRPLHLCMVSLGIVILLCGVWVVSIQAGGGVIDGAPWTAEAEEVLHEESEQQAPQDDDDETSTIRPIRKPKPQIGLGVPPGSIGRETVSESCIPILNSPIEPSRQRRGSRGSQSSQTRPTRRSTLASAPTSPTLQTRFSLRQRLSSVNSELLRHSRGEQAHAAHLHGSLSPSLNPAGFQIGLSAVSPGFAIMPVERRSRQRRRTVSEGDIVGALAETEPPGGRNEGEDGESRVEASGGASQGVYHWRRLLRSLAPFRRKD